MSDTQHELTPLRKKVPANLEKERPEGRHGRVIQVFLNADLRSGHEGLEKLAKDNGITVRDLEPGQYVVFINTHKDRVKLYAAGHVIAYARLEQGRKVDLNAIAHIPRVFQATGKLDYDEALEAALGQALARRARRVLAETKENKKLQ